MNAPPTPDDESPESHPDRRAADPAQAAGRRASDAPVHAILDEMRALRAAQPQPLSVARVAALCVGGATIAGTIIGAVVWFGGQVVGPGARFEEFRRAQLRSDSLSAQERALVLQTVVTLNANVARFGYDVCTSVYKRPERECFDSYLLQSRPPIPNIPATP